MKVSLLQDIISFSKQNKVSANCKPKPCFSSYSQESCDALRVENEMLKSALRNASRIIAQDIYEKQSARA